MRAFRVLGAACAIAAIALLAGCTSKKVFVPPVVPTLQIPKNVAAHPIRSAVILSWTVDDPSKVRTFRVYRATSNGRLVFVDSTTAFSDTIGALQNGQTYTFSVSAIDREKNLEGLRSSTVNATPGTYGITLTTAEGNTAVTKFATVLVRLTSPAGAQSVALGEDPNALTQYVSFPPEGQLPYTFIDPSPLNQGDRRVYARFIDEIGNESGVVSDVIRYDGYAAIDEVSFSPPRQVFSKDDTLYLEARVTGRETGPNARVEFSLVTATRSFEIPIAAQDLGTNGDLVTGDGVYRVAYRVKGQVIEEITDANVQGVFIDNVGNTSLAVTGADVVSLNVPPPPVLITQPIPTLDDRATITWQASSATDVNDYVLYYSTDSLAVATPTECATCPGPPSCTLCRVNIAQGALNADVTGLTPCTRYFFRVFTHDRGGLGSGSSVVGATTTGCPSAPSLR